MSLAFPFSIPNIPLLVAGRKRQAQNWLPIVKLENELEQQNLKTDFVCKYVILHEIFT